MFSGPLSPHEMGELNFCSVSKFQLKVGYRSSLLSGQNFRTFSDCLATKTLKLFYTISRLWILAHQKPRIYLIVFSYNNASLSKQKTYSLLTEIGEGHRFREIQMDGGKYTLVIISRFLTTQLTLLVDYKCSDFLLN